MSVPAAAAPGLGLVGHVVAAHAGGEVEDHVHARGAHPLAPPRGRAPAAAPPCRSAGRGHGCAPRRPRPAPPRSRPRRSAPASPGSPDACPHVSPEPVTAQVTTTSRVHGGKRSLDHARLPPWYADRRRAIDRSGRKPDGSCHAARDRRPAPAPLLADGAGRRAGAVPHRQPPGRPRALPLALRQPRGRPDPGQQRPADHRRAVGARPDHRPARDRLHQLRAHGRGRPRRAALAAPPGRHRVRSSGPSTPAPSSWPRPGCSQAAPSPCTGRASPPSPSCTARSRPAAPCSSAPAASPPAPAAPPASTWRSPPSPPSTAPASPSTSPTS